MPTREDFSTAPELLLELEMIAFWCGGRVSITDGCIEIRTKEGLMRADFGDWIIQEPFPTEDRQFYPCKPEIFEATYSIVWN